MTNTVDTNVGHDTIERPPRADVPPDDRLLALLNGETVPEKPQDEKLPAPEVMTKKQAAALLSVSLRTLDRLVARGEIPNVRLGRRCIRFPIAALKGWLESKTNCKEH